MNHEAYVEWLVKRKAPAYVLPLKILMVFLCVVSVLLGMSPFFGVIGVIVMFLVFGGTYLVFRNVNVEYEYLCVEGQLSIDKILGQSKRKKVVDCTKEEIQVVAPLDNYALKDRETSNMKTVDCSSGAGSAKKYAVIIQSGEATTKVIFEPNDKMLQCFRYYIPGKVIM